MRIYKTIIVTVALLFLSVNAWSLTEEEYARMAADNIRILHEAKGDAQTLSEMSRQYYAKYTEEEKQSYLLMARQVMQDKDMAKRISEKIVYYLTQMGYKVKITEENGNDSITIE